MANILKDFGGQVMEDEQPDPLAWLKRTDFWYEVFKSVISGLIIATIAYVAAVLGGYLARPDTRLLTVVLIAYGLFIVVVIFETRKASGGPFQIIVQVASSRSMIIQTAIFVALAAAVFLYEGN